MTDNPYRTPEANVATTTGMPESQFNHLANGQKLVIYSILLYFAVIALTVFIGPSFSILIIAPFLMALIGVIRSVIGINAHIVWKIIYVILMFIPLLNILALASINNRVTKALRDAGHEVGFLGVKT